MRGSRIQRRLLLAFLAVLFGALLPATILIERRVGDDVREQVRRALEREAVVLAGDLERAAPAPADVPAWVASWEGRADARVTVIAADGRVLGDSGVQASELASLENHGSRPEVIEALQGRAGSSTRSSATLGQEMLYVAVPAGKPPSQVLRLALPLEQVAETVGKAQGAVWLGGLVAVALAAFMARRLARPITAMTRAARAMSRGDFDAPLPPPPDDELGELVRSLATLKTQQASRIAELRGETEKLRTILNGMTEGVALIQH